MRVGLETTSEVTEDQEKMNKFIEQNKFMESRWLAVPLLLREVRFHNW